MYGTMLSINNLAYRERCTDQLAVLNISRPKDLDLIIVTYIQKHGSCFSCTHIAYLELSD